jgi:hypothetical protein
MLQNRSLFLLFSTSFIVASLQNLLLMINDCREIGSTLRLLDEGAHDFLKDDNLKDLDASMFASVSLPAK